MEGNKDEAERCIDLAQKAILDSKYELAEKYLLKSEKLYTTAKARELLDKVQRMQSSKGPNPSKPADEPSVKRRTQGPKKEETVKDYTPEQYEAVKRVKSCKDYYEILGVTKESTDSDIRKAYKKLALGLHPDKNKAPGSAEAFKVVGNAVATLIDPEKRKMYDMYGSERDDDRHSNRSHQHHEAYSRAFESDLTAEELFNMFFGGGFQSSGNVYVRRGNQWRRANEQASQQQHRETNNYTMVMQMLPVLILIGLSMMSSLLVSDPVFSLNQSPKFPVMKNTMNLKVPYYVKENFHQDYQGSIRRLESLVEEEYVVSLRNACYREKNYRDSLIWKARNMGDQNLYSKAQAVRTPSCDTLMQMTRA